MTFLAMQPSELHDIIGVGIVWAIAIAVAYSGYSLSRRIQGRRLADYKDELTLDGEKIAREVMRHTVSKGKA